MSSETDAARLSGVDKASLLLIALGPSAAGTVLKHLTPEEAQLLGSRIAAHRTVDPSARAAVVEEFAKSRESGGTAAGIDFAREVLKQALGQEKAEEILAEVSGESGSKPFSWLRRVGTEDLARALKNERPQVIALVLAHISPARAAEVISGLPEDAQVDAAYRLARFKHAPEDVVRSVESALQAKLQDSTGSKHDPAGGIKSLVDILSNVDRTTESRILEYLERTEANVAENVRSMLFTFEDIAKLDDRSLQLVIQALEQDDLRLAIKGAPEDIKEAFLRNMSQRAADAMREDLEMMGRVRVRDVEAAQRRVVSVVRELQERGEISIGGESGDEDEYLS